jgi:hypothetical protein
MFSSMFNIDFFSKDDQSVFFLICGVGTIKIFSISFFCLKCQKYLILCTKWRSASFAAPSESTVSEDAGIEPSTVETFAITIMNFNHSA